MDASDKAVRYDHIIPYLKITVLDYNLSYAKVRYTTFTTASSRKAIATFPRAAGYWMYVQTCLK